MKDGGHNRASTIIIDSGIWNAKEMFILLSTVWVEDINMADQEYGLPAKLELQD